MLNNGFKFNEDIIKEKTGKTLGEYSKYCIAFLSKLPKNYSVLNGLGEVLDEKQKVFCKTKMLKEVVFLLNGLN